MTATTFGSRDPVVEAKGQASPELMVETWPWAFFTVVSIRPLDAVSNQTFDDMAERHTTGPQEDNGTGDLNLGCDDVDVTTRSKGTRARRTQARDHMARSASLLAPIRKQQIKSAQAIDKGHRSLRPPNGLHTMVTDLRRHAPEWADRLSQATSEHQVLTIITELFNLKHVVRSPRGTQVRVDLSLRISVFVRMNLHKGMTLKLLGQFLGYSEKYCSELFQTTMGGSFSDYVKRCRLETAKALLTGTDRGVSDIAEATGFCDQFAFSHFFKRMTGRSPRDFRTAHAQRHTPRIPLPPL